MTRFYLTLVTVCALGLFSVVSVSKADAADAERPNVLIIMADDCTYNDLPVYGGQNAKTPHIDRLASEGLVFNRAFLAEAMCQPCRAELYSGLYPMTNGCAWNHSASHADIDSMPDYLGSAGYRVGIAGKVHVQPKQAFPFEMVQGFDKSCVRSPTNEHDLGAVREFIGRDSQPFCLVVALVEPHVPWVMGDASQYPPGKLKLPPNIADTDTTRDAFSRYLAEITYMDSQVGELLTALDESGKDRETLVLFTSEQGSQFPGNKWTNYNTGVHTALIARWPGIVPAGKRTEALVQYADVLPTLTDFAGIRFIRNPFDGSSFSGVLLGKQPQHRNYVFGVHNNIPEGPSYPIRSITDGRYHLVKNLSPENLYIEKHLMGIRGDGKLNNRYWQSWVFDSFQNEKALRLIQRYQRRPAVELYDLQDDPYEMTNLAERSEMSDKRAQLSEELDRWLNAQADPGVDQDTARAHKAAKQGNHLYRPKR